MRLYLAGVRAVLPDEVANDVGILVEDGHILAVAPEQANDAVEVRLDGLTLLPGLVDLHCDALEKEIEPRPNGRFPFAFGVAGADKRAAAAGITTAFHAIAFAQDELGLRSNEAAADIAQAVRAWRPHALVDDRVHCRYEITDGGAVAVLETLLVAGAADLLSFMDHTPGQGQFKSERAYEEYMVRTYAKTPAEATALVRRKGENAAGAAERIRTLADAARAMAVPLASHDDDSPARIDRMAALGVTVSEFPVTLEAARAARGAGMRTLVGAPNVLRGGSLTGSLCAIDAIRAGLADCLAADYAPASLLAAVFLLPALAEISLPAAARLATLNPATTAQLHDRGAIAAGKRADLVAVARVGGAPEVVGTWVEGRRVYAVDYRGQ